MRCLISGIGVVTPIGHDVATFWQHSLAGRSGVGSVDRFEIPQHLSRIAGMVTNFDAARRLASDDVRELDRVSQFALVAADEAIADAGLADELRPGRSATRAGVFFSTAISQIGSMERSFNVQTAGGTRRLALRSGAAANNAATGFFDFNSTAALVSKRFGCARGGLTVTTGCTGGLDALGVALQALRRGTVDIAIVGAAEAPITPLVVAAFAKIGATSRRNAEPTRASRPFDADRDGFVLAEGAAMMVLETEASVARRRARVYGEIAGYASVNSCFHMTDIAEHGAPIARSIRLALADAGLCSGDIDAINAHGSSTQQNDIAETAAYYSVFGARSEVLPVTSIKSQIGHPLGASNSIEVASALLTLRHGEIAPTINLERKDPRCALDVVSGAPRRGDFRCILKTSSGFSGIHSSLIIKR